MSDFLAVYFLLWIAGGATVVSLIWRYWVLYIASGLAWAIVSFYSLINSHGGNRFVMAFTFFCLAMSLVMFLAYYWIPRMRMKKGEYTPFNTAEDWETPEGRKQHEVLWGKPHKAEEEEQLSKSQRRKKGEWVE
uniref:Uncharacterized protein n=1 Tax=viral metagenome TaxID=1070528 RepID=A0A6M3L4A7_9ZZZZ